MQVRRDEKGKDEHATYMMTLHNLAELYCDQGHYKNAHLLFVKAAALRRKRFGDGSAMVAATLERHALRLKQVCGLDG